MVSKSIHIVASNTNPSNSNSNQNQFCVSLKIKFFGFREIQDRTIMIISQNVLGGLRLDLGHVILL